MLYLRSVPADFGDVFLYLPYGLDDGSGVLAYLLQFQV